MIDINHCFLKNSQIICKQIKDEILLLDHYRQAAIKLNPVAYELWQLIDGRHSILQIIGLLHERFEGEKKIIEKDVLSFIKELIKREIIS